MKMHCRAIISTLFALILAVPLIADAVPKKVYPTAAAPEEFDLQVEELLRATVEIGDGFGGPYDRELEDRTRRDDRNWERALARIIGDPGKYGFPLGEQAICVAKLRGKQRNDIIVSSAEVYFDEIIKDAMKKHADFKARGEKVPYNVPGKVKGMISTILDFHDPRTLRVILRHLTSDEAMTLGTLAPILIKQIPEELRAYGDSTHHDGAVALAQRLLKAGRVDEADGILKWAQRAAGSGHGKRPPAKSLAEGKNRSGNLSNDVNKSDGRSPNSSMLLVWIASGLIAGAIGILAWRRLKP